jgi:hypothetical protein
MDLWDNIQALRSLSHGLMWGAIIVPILAAAIASGAVGFRYYDDRRIGELSSAAQTVRETKLQAAIDSARQRQEAAEAEVVKLQAKAAPRLLNEPQRQALIGALRNGQQREVKVTYVIGDAEAAQFANILRAVREAGGWRVNGFGQGLFSQPIHGLRIAVKQDPPPDAAIELFHALDRVGLAADGNLTPRLEEGQIELWVGSK